MTLPGSLMNDHCRHERTRDPRSRGCGSRRTTESKRPTGARTHLWPALSASSIVVLARSDGDNTVRPAGTAGNQFVNNDGWVLVQPVRERDAPLSPLNARRGMFEFDVFGSLGDPFLEESSDWQPGDSQITRALLKLPIDSGASSRGIGTYDVYGYRARNQLLPRTLRTSRIAFLSAPSPRE